MTMADEFILLKLGGSLITDKDTPYTPKTSTLARLAREIRQFLEAQPSARLLLGHGSGSFGHVAAQQYHTRDGVFADDMSEPESKASQLSRGIHAQNQEILKSKMANATEYWRGFAEVRYQAAELNRYVIQALRKENLPALPFPPSATLVSAARRAALTNILAMRKCLDARLLPVVYGDVAFDETLGGTILSTEDVFAILVDELPVTRILLAGIEPGVWEDFPMRKKLARQMRRAEYESIRKGVQGSVSADVTGGMKSKVEGMFALVERHQQLSAQIFSAEEAGALTRALRGENVGTLLIT